MTNKYTIGFKEKEAVIVLEDNTKAAVISCPKLEDEVALPIQYPVTYPDDRLVGTVSSYLPESRRVVMRNGDKESSLIIGGNEELILKTKDRKFDIGRVSLEDIAEEEAVQLDSIGFTRGYKLRSSQESGKLYFFEKDGKQRATLTLDKSDFVEFLPIVLYDRIKQDIAGKKIKKLVPERKPLQVVRKEGDGAFVRSVKENISPRFLQEAFTYQDIEGEKEIFFELLDHGTDPVILNGPTGNGKSVLAQDFAFTRGIPYYFNNGTSSFRISQAIGSFVPSPGNPTFSPGSLTLAMIFGGMYVFEEMAPVPQDELTGINRLLETNELPIITQFGYEVITAHPNFKFVATGNFHSNYTTNELNDAFLQRFAQIKIGYPDKDNTVSILQARAPGVDYSTAELVTDVLMKMRPEAMAFSKDLGLKGVVKVCQRLQMGTNIPMKKLFEVEVVNPLTTYENNIERTNGKLYSKLMKIVDESVVGV